MYGSKSLTAVTAAALAAGAQAQSLNATNGTAGYISYSTVTGYFAQDDAATNASTFDYTATNFGLKNQSYPGFATGNLTQWQQFAQVVNSLNANADLNTAYKVLFMGRHGEGYHNAAESFYGTPAWNCYWSELTGNSTNTWEDADLTPAGIDQALIAANFWKYEIATQHIPYPQSYYTSPLTRCLKTANLTFSTIETPHYYPFIPTVKELFREGISTHTCDHRSNETYIHSLFPTWNIEPGFTEYDQLWNGTYAEPSAAQDARSKRVLDQVFSSDDHTWISITSHSGEIASILRTLGHRTFSLSTGAVIPVLVKAQFLPASDKPTTTSTPWTSTFFCTNGPPITSNTAVTPACQCSGGSGMMSGSGIASATAYPTAYGL